MPWAKPHFLNKNPSFRYHSVCFTAAYELQIFLKTAKRPNAQTTVFCTMLRSYCPASLIRSVCTFGGSSVSSLSTCIPAMRSLKLYFIYRVEKYQGFWLLHSPSLFMSPITTLFPSEGWKTGSLRRYPKFSTRGDATASERWLMWMNDAFLKYLSYSSTNRLCQPPE